MLAATVRKVTFLRYEDVACTFALKPFGQTPDELRQGELRQVRVSASDTGRYWIKVKVKVEK